MRSLIRFPFDYYLVNVHKARSPKSEPRPLMRTMPVQPPTRKSILQRKSTPKRRSTPPPKLQQRRTSRRTLTLLWDLLPPQMLERSPRPRRGLVKRITTVQTKRALQRKSTQRAKNHDLQWDDRATLHPYLKSGGLLTM